jgi:hypothetical protein
MTPGRHVAALRHAAEIPCRRPGSSITTLDSRACLRHIARLHAPPIGGEAALEET